MSRKGNCWDNAQQESFHGHMKDHVKDSIARCTELSPNEFYKFCLTGEYPIDIPNRPTRLKYVKSADELGAKTAIWDEISWLSPCEASVSQIISSQNRNLARNPRRLPLYRNNGN